MWRPPSFGASRSVFTNAGTADLLQGTTDLGDNVCDGAIYP